MPPRLSSGKLFDQSLEAAEIEAARPTPSANVMLALPPPVEA